MRVKNVMLVNAGEFVAAGLFWNTVENIECGLYRPTDKQRRRNVIFCPLQHLLDLWPIGNVVEFHQA